jgi:lysophospholipase L1-like esterase
VASALLGRGRIFETHAELGWRFRPNLDQQRRNADGAWYRFATDGCGLRGSSRFDPEAALRILVLGDSFAAGEGVAQEDRFDSQIARIEPGWSFVNLGTSGYGTDQALLAALPYGELLRPGDVALLLAYGNDFYDILRHTMSGRAKPWFELIGGELVHHPPDLGLRDWLRDRSYLASRLFALAELAAGEGDHDPDLAGALWLALVRNARASLAERGVHWVEAHHGLDLFGDAGSVRAHRAAVERLCSSGDFHCLDLDPFLASAQEPVFLGDLHWNANGHQRVATALHALLASLAR